MTTLLSAALLLLAWLPGRRMVAPLPSGDHDEYSLPSSEISLQDNRWCLLQTVLCYGYCQDDCRMFVTPMDNCYNGKQLFPEDPSWSDFDILDEVVGDDTTVFRRKIFQTTNSTCGSTDFDTFVLPSDGSCVGPFGEPRPWGNFSVIRGERERQGLVATAT